MTIFPVKLESRAQIMMIIIVLNTTIILNKRE